MKPEWIKEMKEQERLKLSFWQKVDHYSIVLFLLIVPGLTLYDLLENFITKTDDSVRSASELMIVSFPFLIISVVFYFIQKKRLRFKAIEITYTDEEFQEAINRTITSLGWEIEYNKGDFFRAYRPWNWTGSWGEMITIIKHKDRLLMNSICDPNKMSSVTSYGWNKKNIKTFLLNLIEVKRLIPVKSVREIEKTEKKWTVKKVMIRFIAYLFCLFLIVVGLFLIIQSPSGDLNSIGFGLIAIIIPLLYLYPDFQQLWKKI